MANRLKEKYLNEVVPSLTEQFNYSSAAAGREHGVGDAASNAKTLKSC